MIPLRDENPTHSFPIVTYLLIALNVLVFIFQTSLGQSNQSFVYQFAIIPAQLTSNLAPGDILDIFTSMFMHAGLAHIGGNKIGRAHV